MSKYISADKFVEWHSQALSDYLSKQYLGDTHHVLDLAVAAASFSEAFYLIVEHMPE